MSWIVKDARCPDGHYEVDVLVRTNEGPPPCPECGKGRSFFYATREQANAKSAEHTVGGGFREFVLGGEVMRSQQDVNRFLDRYAKSTGKPRESLALDSTGGRQASRVRADEMRHEAWVLRRSNGFDGQTYERYKAEQRAQRARQEQR